MILDGEVIVKRCLLSTLNSLSIANAIHPVVKEPLEFWKWACHPYFTNHFLPLGPIILTPFRRKIPCCMKQHGIFCKSGNMLVNIKVSNNHLLECFEAFHVNSNMFDICKPNCLICSFIHGCGLSSTCPKIAHQIWQVLCKIRYIVGSEVFDESWKHRAWIKTCSHHLFGSKGLNVDLIKIATLCSYLLSMRSIKGQKQYYFLLWSCIWLFTFLASNLVFLLDFFGSIKNMHVKFQMCPKGDDDMVTSFQSNSMNDILPTLFKKTLEHVIISITFKWTNNSLHLVA